VYHTISFLSCLEKVVENVVAEMSSEHAEKNGQLNDAQFGSSKRQSVIDAAAIMINRAHNAWLHGNIVRVLLIYIKAAFPSMANRRLVNAMKDKCMYGDLIRYTHNCLSERTVEMVLEGNAMERQPEETGVPLGSPASPILFAIYTAELIAQGERLVAICLSYVDDICWIATGPVVNEVVRKFEAYCAESFE
jgi:hypothetical protein